jgi:hypothetical protein
VLNRHEVPHGGDLGHGPISPNGWIPGKQSSDETRIGQQNKSRKHAVEVLKKIEKEKIN